MSIHITIKGTRNVVPGRQAFSFRADLESSGGVLGLMGPSGAGKTSFLDALAGILRDVQGTIRVGDTFLLDTENRIDLPIRDRRVGYVFQDSQLFPHLNVEENLQFGMRYHSGGDGDLSGVVQMLRLKGLLQQNAQELSGGERQRVCLGRALLSNPRILLLDEPITGVDVEHRQAILPFLRNVFEVHRVPIIYVSHQAQEVANVMDEFFWMENGVLGQSDGVPIGGTSADSELRGVVLAHLPSLGVTQVEVLGRRLPIPLIQEASVGSEVVLGLEAKERFDL